MTWIDDIHKVYNQYFKDAFEKLGLLTYEEMDGLGMGALVKFKNDSFRLQIVNDRGILEMDISPLVGDEQFRGLELFNSLLRLNANKNMSESEKRKIHGTRLDYEGQKNFLWSNSETLTILLNKANYTETLKKIDALGQERSRLLFN